MYGLYSRAASNQERLMMARVRYLTFTHNFVCGVFVLLIHSCSKCLPRMACLWIKMPMFGNEGARVTTPTSISMFDSNDMKSLWFKFSLDIFTGFKKLKIFNFISLTALKNERSNYKDLPFWNLWRYHNQIHSSQALHVIIKYWKACGSGNPYPRTSEARPYLTPWFLPSGT